MAQYVVWWTYVANYSEPRIVEAETAEEAMEKGIFYTAKANNFTKYAVRMENGSTLTVVE
jgi:hypothetical protein